MIINFQKQEFPIFTNNFVVEIDRNNVNRDFVIFQIGTENSFFANNVLDITTIKAYSVAYYRNNRWFVMFLNDGKYNFDDFKKEIQKNDSSAVINQVDLFSTDFEAKNAIKKVELAQLLINTLKNNKSFGYNNITGSLYYQPDNYLDSKSFELLKLRFFIPNQDNDSQLALEANFESFTEYDILKEHNKKAKIEYVIDKESGEIRKYLKSDFEYNKENKKNKYVFYSKGVISRKGKKRHEFLNFNTNEQFEPTKAGLISKFSDDVKNRLADYIKIEQFPIYEYESFDEPFYENIDYKKYLLEKKRGFCIVDTINETESKKLQDSIIEYLKNEYEISDIKTERKNGNYIIEIIHQPDYYDAKEKSQQPSLFPELDKPDQHNLFTEKDIIQHVTIENFDTEKSKMDNIIQELIIKGDIYDKKISIVNWNEEKTWNFVCCGTGKWNESKKIREYIYYKASITTDGIITFSEFDSRNFPEDDEWEIIDNIFRFYNKNNVKNHPVECIIYNDIKKINVIYQTKQFTLPHLEKLSNDLKLTDKRNEVSKDLIVSILKKYKTDFELKSEAEIKEISQIEKNLNEETSENITIGSLLKSVRIQTIGRLLDFFEENGIKLHSRPRAKDNIYENFNSLLGVKVAKINGIYEYFVGRKKDALKYSLPTSCVIRSVNPWEDGEEKKDGEVFLDEYAHMLTVEFVRNGQYTVVPFPMKYLNEYKKIREKDEDFD